MADTVYIRRVKTGLSERSKRRRFRMRNPADEPRSDEVGVKHWKYIKGVYEDLLRKDAPSAEKKLRKLLKKDPKNVYARSKMISMYSSWSTLVNGGSNRLEDAEKLCEKAVKLGIDSSAVASAVISVYGKLDKFDKAWDVFLAAVNGEYADSAAYNSMMHICSVKHNIEYGTKVFGLAKTNKVEHLNLYANMAQLYLNRRKYWEAIRVIEDAPRLIRDLPNMKLYFFECHKKLRNYGKVIEDADKFLSGYGDGRFDDAFYVQARTVRAYCVMHSGRELDALEEFAILKWKVARTSIHYPRILCGFVFCRPALTDAEREQLIAELDFFTAVASASMRDKVIRALKVLSANDRVLPEQSV